MTAQQHTTWTVYLYLSSHSGENCLGLNDPTIITKSFKKCSISTYLDGMEDEVLWAEHYDKSDTDSDEESEQIQ